MLAHTACTGLNLILTAPNCPVLELWAKLEAQTARVLLGAYLRPRIRRRAHWRKEQEVDAHNEKHKIKSTNKTTDNQQTHLKRPPNSLHYTPQHTHARLFLERGAAFFPSFPQPSGEYKIEFDKRQTGMVSRAKVLCGCGRSSCPARGLVLRGQSSWRLVRRKSLLPSFVERTKSL